MKPGPVLKAAIAILLVVATLFGAAAPPASAQAADWDIPNGHFFTQTGKGESTGFAVTDDDEVAFWSEFKRLGGMNGVGYPVSHRFEWNGYTCQAFQRVVFQWQPDAKSVSFVNVFDLMHDTGKDAWLKTVRQTPEPKQWNEDGLPWDQVVKGRLAVMDAFPEIKKAYMGVGGDPIQMNGLPTTDVVDMGNNYILRAQRVVIQQWKEDVPWAKKGQVTFGLGGSIAVESETIPGGPVAGPSKLYFNQGQKFIIQYPGTWLEEAGGDFTAAFKHRTPDRSAILAHALIRANDEIRETVTQELVANYYRSEQFKQSLARTYSEVSINSVSVGTVNGMPAVRVIYTVGIEGVRLVHADYAIIDKGKARMYEVVCATVEEDFASYKSTFDWIAGTVRSTD